jgi:hypothetical protein
VVIVIIAVMAALLLPALSRARFKAQGNNITAEPNAPDLGRGTSRPAAVATAERDSK